MLAVGSYGNLMATDRSAICSQPLSSFHIKGKYPVITAFFNLFLFLPQGEGMFFCS